MPSVFSEDSGREWFKGKMQLVGPVSVHWGRALRLCSADVHLNCALQQYVHWVNESDAIAGVGDKDAVQSFAIATHCNFHCNILQRRLVKDCAIHQKFKEMFVTSDPATLSYSYNQLLSLKYPFCISFQLKVFVVVASYLSWKFRKEGLNGSNAGPQCWCL